MSGSPVREQILTQLEVLLATVPNVVSVFRNRAQIPSRNQLPALTLLDGAEVNTMEEEAVRHKSVMFPGGIMELSPQIWIQLVPRDTDTNLTINGAPAEPIGPDLSTLCDDTVNTIVNDPTLIAILGGPRSLGQMIYRGLHTDFATGASMKGAAVLLMSFRYWWQPPRG